MNAGIQKSGVMLNVPFGAQVFLAVVIKFKNVFIKRDFLLFFADDMPFQMLVRHFLLGHGSPVFEAPVSWAHVIIFVVGIGSVCQRVLEERTHFGIGIQLVVFLFGQHHRLPFDVGLAVCGIRVIIPRFFGEKQDGLVFLQLVFKRVRIFQGLGRIICSN